MNTSRENHLLRFALDSLKDSLNELRPDWNSGGFESEYGNIRDVEKDVSVLLRQLF